VKTAEDEIDYCADLIRAGTFDDCDLAKRSNGVCHWYSSSGSLRLVETSYEGNFSLSTSVRARFSDGMLQFIDNRCIEIEGKYTIQAKFQVRDMSGNVVACNPLARNGDNACPRASIRPMIEGEVSTYFLPFAKAIVPVSPDGWNDLMGTFTVDSEIAAADSLAVVIDGPDAGLNIVIDNITLTPFQRLDPELNPGGCA